MVWAFTHAHTRTIINLYTIRGKCHMIAESAQPRNPSPDPFPRSGWGLGPRLEEPVSCIVGERT